MALSAGNSIDRPREPVTIRLDAIILAWLKVKAMGLSNPAQRDLAPATWQS